MTEQLQSKDYYSLNNLESYGSPITAVFGERGNGKTHSALEKMVRLFEKEGKESAYMRRTEAELETIKDDIFNDIIPLYPKYKFELKGSDKSGYRYTINGKTFCYLFALSTSYKMKGTSKPNLYFTFFDEYIPENLQFLKNEPNKILSYISTVYRHRKFRVHFASNSISYVCPLLEMFKVYPRGDREFYKVKANNKLMFVLQITGASAYRDKMKQTDIYALSELVNLDGYMFNNKALLDNDAHIVPKKPSGFDTSLCVFKVDGKSYGVWINQDSSAFYFYDKYDKAELNYMAYYIYPEDKSEGYYDIRGFRREPFVKRIKELYNRSACMFKNQKCKRVFINNIIYYL